MDMTINKVFNNDFFHIKRPATTLSYILIVLVITWLILYAVPGLLASLFNTILGNIILLVGIILVGIKDIKIATALIILFIIIFKFSYYVTKTREGFPCGPQHRSEECNKHV